MDQVSKIDSKTKIFISNPNLFNPQKTIQRAGINFSQNLKKTPTKQLFVKRPSKNFDKNISNDDKCRTVFRMKKSNLDGNHNLFKIDSNHSGMTRSNQGNEDIQDKIDIITKTPDEIKTQENLSGLNDLSGIEVINLSDEEMNDDLLCLIEDKSPITTKNDHREKAQKKANLFNQNFTKRATSTTKSIITQNQSNSKLFSHSSSIIKSASTTQIPKRKFLKRPQNLSMNPSHSPSLNQYSTNSSPQSLQSLQNPLSPANTVTPQTFSGLSTNCTSPSLPKLINPHYPKAHPYKSSAPLNLNRRKLLQIITPSDLQSFNCK